MPRTKEQLTGRYITTVYSFHDVQPCHCLMLCRGWQGFIAYGCQSLVVVYNVKAGKKLQVLDQHKFLVSQVRTMHTLPNIPLVNLMLVH